MNALACFGGKTMSLIGGLVLLAIGVVFFVSGLTVLPVMGFVVAFPAFIAAYPLLRSAFKEACEYYGN
jgi:hypothetical protein